MRHVGMVLAGTPGSIRDAARAWLQVKAKAGHATCPGTRLRARAVSFLCISVRHFPPGAAERPFGSVGGMGPGFCLRAHVSKALSFGGTSRCRPGSPGAVYVQPWASRRFGLPVPCWDTQRRRERAHGTAAAAMLSPRRSVPS